MAVSLAISDLRLAFFGDVDSERDTLIAAAAQGKDLAGLIAGTWGGGIILTSPNATRYRLKVANDGTLSTELVV